MNTNVEQYLDALFAAAPAGREVQDLKEELLANMKDRYADYQKEGKTQEEAYQLTVASMGDVRALIDEIAPPSRLQPETSRQDAIANKTVVSSHQTAQPETENAESRQEKTEAEFVRLEEEANACREQAMAKAEQAAEKRTAEAEQFAEDAATKAEQYAEQARVKAQQFAEQAEQVVVKLGQTAEQFVDAISEATLHSQSQGVDGAICMEFEGVEAVDVNLLSYRVEIATHSGDTVLVEIRKNGLLVNFLEHESPLVQTNGNILCVREPSGFTLGAMFGWGRIRIFLPQNKVCPCRVCTASGTIILDAPVTVAELKSTSGSVKVYQGGGALNVSSVSGSVKVFAPFDELVAKSTSGSVKAVANASTKSVWAKSISGSVKIALMGVMGYQMKYSTTSGTVKDVCNSIRYDKKGCSSWGDGSLHLELSSTSGSLKLTSWGDE